MSPRVLLSIIALFGAICVGIGVYLIIRPPTLPVVQTPSKTTAVPATTRSTSETPIANQSSQARTGSPQCIVKYGSGSCWTIPIPSYSPCGILDTPPSTIEINDDTCTLFVPATERIGVSTDGFVLNKGEQFQISAQGRVNFSSDHPCVGPEGLFGWYDPYVNSPFKQNVGGLEFSIGSLKNNRMFVGSQQVGIASTTGELIFRIIEREEGYTDNNSGGFKVTVKRIKNE